MLISESCETNLSHEVNNFRLSLALLVKKFIEAFAEILVHELISIQRFVLIIVNLRRSIRIWQAAKSLVNIRDSLMSSQLITFYCSDSVMICWHFRCCDHSLDNLQMSNDYCWLTWMTKSMIVKREPCVADCYCYAADSVES